MNIASVRRPLEGYEECGDASVVVEQDNGILVAVADGLGHGSEAAEASEMFCAFVGQHANDGLEEILRGADKELRHTRGTAATLLRVDTERHTITIAGVGNVNVAAYSAEPIRPALAPGIIGRRLRRVSQFQYPLVPGDLVVTFSDGIMSRNLDLTPYKGQSAQNIAEDILTDRAKETDDAICVVVCY